MLSEGRILVLWWYKMSKCYISNKYLSTLSLCTIVSLNNITEYGYCGTTISVWVWSEALLDLHNCISIILFNFWSFTTGYYLFTYSSIFALFSCFSFIMSFLSIHLLCHLFIYIDIIFSAESLQVLGLIFNI